MLLKNMQSEQIYLLTYIYIYTSINFFFINFMFSKIFYYQYIYTTNKIHILPNHKIHIPLIYIIHIKSKKKCINTSI